MLIILSFFRQTTSNLRLKRFLKRQGPHLHLLHEATAIRKKSESLLTLFARCHSKYNSSAAVEDTEIDVLGTTKTLRSQIFYFTCMSFWDFVYLPIALIRNDVTKISRNVKPRFGDDRFA